MNDSVTDPSAYTPPKVWTWNKASGGRFASINRPIAGPTHDKELPVGAHPMQLYSLATPNGVKVTVMLEELLALGHSGAEYDAWLVNILGGDQFGSGFVSSAVGATARPRPGGRAASGVRVYSGRHGVSKSPGRSKLQLQGELDDTRRLAGLDDRLRRRRGHRGAAGLRENRRAEARASDRGVARVVEVRVVEGVEQLGPKLQPHRFGDAPELLDAEVEVRVPRRLEDVAPHAVRAGVRKLESARIRKHDRPDDVRDLLKPRFGLRPC